MVHCMHQDVHRCVSYRAKWCTTCTKFPAFRHPTSRNGVLRTPFFRIFGIRIAEMVHGVHHYPSTLHDLRANGASGAPFPAVSITNSRRMVHQVHHVGRFRWSPNQNGRVCSSSGCPALRGPISETSIPAKISTAPTVSRGLSTSPSMSHPKNAANTGSAEYMSAA